MNFFDDLSIAEIIGYFASVFIVLSFVFNNVRTIRIINAVGCLCFVVYAYYFEAWPVLIPNAILFFVQLYYLFIKKDKA